MSTLAVNNITEVGGDAVVTSGVLDSGSLPTGTVLQVVSTAKTDAFSASLAQATWGAVTGLSASITPSNASNKILITVNMAVSQSTDGVSTALTRNGTNIGVADSAGSRLRASASTWQLGGYEHRVLSFSYLDSPATTSAVTYGLVVAPCLGSGTQTVYVNRTATDADGSTVPRMISTITLMEIAG